MKAKVKSTSTKVIMPDIFSCLFWWNSPSREYETPEPIQRTYEFIQWYNQRNPNKNKWFAGI